MLAIFQSPTLKFIQKKQRNETHYDYGLTTLGELKSD